MKHFNTARKYITKIVTQPRAGAMAFIGGCAVAPAYAEDYTTLITGAQTDAEGNQKAVITAVIGVAILTFGVVAFLAWLKK